VVAEAGGGEFDGRDIGEGHLVGRSTVGAGEQESQEPRPALTLGAFGKLGVFAPLASDCALMLRMSVRSGTPGVRLWPPKCGLVWMKLSNILNTWRIPAPRLTGSTPCPACWSSPSWRSWPGPADRPPSRAGRT